MKRGSISDVSGAVKTHFIKGSLEGCPVLQTPVSGPTSCRRVVS